MWTEVWTSWYRECGGPVPYRPAEDLAFAVLRATVFKLLKNIMEELILAGNLRVGSLPLTMTMMLLLMNTIVAEVDEEKQSSMDRWKGLAFDISDDQQDITRGKGMVDLLFQAPMNSGTHNGAPMITSVPDSPIRARAEQFLTLSAFDAPPIIIALAAIVIVSFWHIEELVMNLVVSMMLGLLDVFCGWNL
ncbi:uncharacterized protein LOC141708273 isoform X2 [Apium graveolens]|uniref:uncharacterized protein LOC141708273 isoform X2 n=1 Tax=Apium graveolens TaxID=4045 RepID=UPI003D7B5DF2